MRKQCEVCPAEFEAKRASARFCSERCKKRAQRSPGRKAGEQPGRAAAQAGKAAEPPGGLTPGALMAATEAKLAAAGRLDGPEGQAAMILACRIDLSPFSAETGASVAALVRQLHATLAQALAGARAAADPVEDELRTARERRRALAGG